MKLFQYLTVICLLMSMSFSSRAQNLGTEISDFRILFDISDNQSPFPFNNKDWWTAGKGFAGAFEIAYFNFVSDLIINRVDFIIDKASGNVGIGAFNPSADLEIYQEGNNGGTSGIRIDDGTDQWNIYIKGNNEHDISFAYKGVIKAEIEEYNGFYV